MRVAIACSLGLFVGCGASGPATTDASSATLPTLAERSEFFERYVTFRRSYQELHFHIIYHNGGAFPPSLSGWDIRAVATVPREELGAWVPDGVPAAPTAEVAWLERVPGGVERAAGVTEWYTQQGRLVGIDRVRSVVAYRLWAR